MMDKTEQPSTGLKLFMILIGSKAPNRNVEQHDYYFGIAASLKELVPEIKAFWPEAGNSIHLDGWREVNKVDNYQIGIYLKSEHHYSSGGPKLFFINLGGYQPGKLEEQHYTVLTVQDDRLQAIKAAKSIPFFTTNTIKTVKGATAHIDEKYGLDVDDIYRIEDLLTPAQKDKYHISITPSGSQDEDEIHLGYFKLDKI